MDEGSKTQPEQTSGESQPSESGHSQGSTKHHTFQEGYHKFENSVEKQLRKYSASEIVIFSFLFVIVAGSFILYLIENTAGNPLKAIDAVFTATSAVCVTGLTTVDFSRFSLAGQILVMVLIQVGGFGIIAAFRLLWLGRASNLPAGSTHTLGSVLDCDEPTRRRSVFQILASTAKITLAIELIGFLILYAHLYDRIHDMSPLWFSLFHTISAFNNAGFGLYPDSLMQFRDDVTMNLIISALFIFGGIGYPVILGIERIGLVILHKAMMILEVLFESLVMRRPERIRYVEPFYNFVDRILHRSKKIEQELAGVATPLQMKVVIYGTLTLIMISTLFVLWSEWNNPSTADNSFGEKLLVAFFHSVSSRTCGFNTVDISLWGNRTLMFFVMLMFIGAGPQGTAGGIKIPTFVTLLAYIRASFRGRPKVKIFGYTVSKISVGNAVKLYVMSSTFILFIILLLTITEERYSPIQLIFEAVSAFGTVGLSMGITTGLTTSSKMLIIITMFTGRVGLINIGSAILKPKTEVSQSQITIDDGMKLQIG